VFCLNDSYMGLDFGFDMDFTILQDDPEREIIPVNKEDQDAVKGPGLVQSMLEAQDDEASGDESSEDDLDTLKSKLEKAGLK